jgi:hypothetical protein
MAGDILAFSRAVKPPSPESEITWRRGKAAWAPMACAIAFAIEPCQNEPTRRRRPLSQAILRSSIFAFDPPTDIGTSCLLRRTTAFSRDAIAHFLNVVARVGRFRVLTSLAVTVAHSNGAQAADAGHYSWWHLFRDAA